MTQLSRSRGVRIFIVIKVATIKPLLGHVSSGSDTKSIQFSIEIGLRLDERAAVISHRLISRVGILREYSITRSDKYHQ